MKLAELKEDFFFSLRYPRVRAGIAGVVVSVLLGLVIGMAYWLPIAHTTNKLKADIDDRRLKFASTEHIVRLAQASGYAAQQMALIEKKLDTSFTQAALVQNIAALARRHNVKIVSEAYEDGKTKDGYSPLVHEITVQAGYSELRGFISGMQQLPTFTIVQEAVLSRSANTSAVKAQLYIITYRRAAG